MNVVDELEDDGENEWELQQNCASLEVAVADMGQYDELDNSPRDE